MQIEATPGPNFSWEAMSGNTFSDTGNLSIFLLTQFGFILGLWSFSTRSMLRLRVLQVFSGVIGVISNGYIFYTSPSLTMLAINLWLLTFTIINGTMAYRIRQEGREIELEPEIKKLFSSSFPMMFSQHVKKLKDKARELALADGERLTFSKLSFDSVYLVAEGNLIHHLPDGERCVFKPGALLGEEGFLIHETPEMLTGDYYAMGPVKLLVWAYEELRESTETAKIVPIAGSLIDGFARSLGAKGDFVQRGKSDCIELQSRKLSQPEMDLHSNVFPFLSTSGVALLLDKAVKLSYRQSDQFDITDGLAVLLEGKLQIKKEDGLNVYIDRHEFVGEFGFIAPERAMRGPTQTIGLNDTELLYWSKEILGEIENLAPRTYLEFYKSVSRSLVYKAVERVG